MDKIEVKREVRYVVGTMDVVPFFIARDYETRDYRLTDNIAVALKCIGKEAAVTLLALYKKETGDKNEFAVLPVEVSYRLID